jgi:heme/copper-type cytochrome/quinol oxidase subunit 2
MWKVEHAEGQREINELHVPVGRDVKLIMTSQDVIHSFYIPAFRIKQDVLPGRYTVEWFRATKPGTYHLFCAEYCGTQHSGMVGSIVVHGAGAVRSLDERRFDRSALRHRRENFRRTRLLHLPSHRHAGPRP